MEKKMDMVGFALKRIITEQFAIVEEAYDDKLKINLGTNIRFTVDREKQMIGVFSLFKFEQGKIPFLILEVACHFQIAPASWKTFSISDTEKLVIPQGFMSHLAMLTVGTARGILHTKTEGTHFNQFLLPTINVADMIKSDVTF